MSFSVLTRRAGVERLLGRRLLSAVFDLGDYVLVERHLALWKRGLAVSRVEDLHQVFLADFAWFGLLHSALSIVDDLARFTIESR
jgi:hypothetical protein